MNLRGCPSLVLVLSLLSPALRGENFVVNGDFEKGKTPEETWHVRLADFMPSTLHSEDFRRRSYFYLCGCGEYLGVFRPWAGLICPKCRGFIGGEESGDWYLQNHDYVSFDKGVKGAGRSLKLTCSEFVGNNQGVRVFSRMFHVKPDWGYIMEFDTKTKGCISRVFAECYRYDREAIREGSIQASDDDQIKEGGRAGDNLLARDGISIIKPDTVRDWSAFAAKIRDQAKQEQPSPGKRIWELLSAEQQKLFEQAAGAEELDEKTEDQLAKALNGVIEKRDFFKEESFPQLGKGVPKENKKDWDFTEKDAMYPKLKAALKRCQATLSPDQARSFHRQILGVCYPESFPDRLGDPKGSRGIDVSDVKAPIEKCYRGHVNAGGPGDWTHFTKEMVAPAREKSSKERFHKDYRFEYITVKLYAYMPGEAWFDNVEVRSMTQSELETYIANKKYKKDDGFNVNEGVTKEAGKTK